jgi:hypothetical protein
VISPRRNRASLAIQDVFGNYIAGFGFMRSLKMGGMNDVIQMRLRVALGCALWIIASNPSDALAQSRHTDARASGPRLSFLSEPRSEELQPDEEMPRATPEEDNKGYDGAWTFTSAGCRHTGSLVALIIDGKIVVRGGSGQVDPDGTLHSVGAAKGMTLSAVGRLSGNTGAGTFNRSDGCVGSWIAIKHAPSPGLRRSGLRRWSRAEYFEANSIVKDFCWCPLWIDGTLGVIDCDVVTGEWGRKPGRCMRGYTTKEKLKITAGAVSALVIVAWIVVLAIVFLSVRWKNQTANGAS